MSNRQFQNLARTMKAALAVAVLATSARAQMAENQLVAVVNHEPPAKVVYYAPGASAKTDVQPTYARQARKLSAAYDGFAVELMATDFPLSRENALFRQFGRVFFERGDDGKWHYLILAPSFSSKKGVEDFIAMMLSKRAPGALAVEYREGKRK